MTPAEAVTAARAAYDADKTAANQEALEAAVEAFHLGQLLTRKDLIGKAARKRANDAALAPSPAKARDPKAPSRAN